MACLPLGTRLDLCQLSHPSHTRSQNTHTCHFRANSSKKGGWRTPEDTTKARPAGRLARSALTQLTRSPSIHGKSRPSWCLQPSSSSLWAAGENPFSGHTSQGALFGDSRSQRGSRWQPPGRRRGLHVRAKGWGEKTPEVIQKQSNVVLIQLWKIQQGTSGATLPNVIKKYAKKLGPESVMATLWELIRRGDWQRALDTFDVIRRLTFYDPDPAIYTALIALLARKGQLERAVRVFGGMEEQRCPRTAAAYTAMLDAYGKLGNLEAAIDMFEEMKGRPGCEPDSTTYSALMRALCRARRMEQADSLLEEMAERHVAPTEVTFNTLIDGYGRFGKVEGMQRKYCQMLEEHGLTPDEFTFNALIKWFGFWGHLEQMEACFESMQRQLCAPDLFTFNAMVEAYGKWGELDKMGRTFNHMVRFNYRLNFTTYSLVISAWGRAGRLDQVDHAWRVLTHAQKARPNEVVMCALVHAYGRHRRLERVGALLRYMRASGLSFDTAVYNAALDAYGRAQAYAEMEALAAQMAGDGCAPDVGTYAAQITAYARGGLLSRAEQAFAAMRSAGLKPSLLCFNSLLGLYSQLGQHEQVLQVMAECRAAGLYADADTYNALMEAYSRAGLYAEMEQALAELRGSRMRPNARTLRVLTEAYAQAGLLEKMERSLRALSQGGPPPAVGTYGAAIGAYCAAGQVEKADALLAEMLKRQVAPDGAVYSSLARGHGRENLLEAVSLELLEVEESEMSASLKGCATLLFLLSACSHRADADWLLSYLAKHAGGAFRTFCQLLLCSPSDGAGMLLLWQETLQLFDDLDVLGAARQVDAAGGTTSPGAAGPAEGQLGARDRYDRFGKRVDAASHLEVVGLRGGERRLGEGPAPSEARRAPHFDGRNVINGRGSSSSSSRRRGLAGDATALERSYQGGAGAGAGAGGGRAQGGREEREGKGEGEGEGEGGSMKPRDYKMLYLSLAEALWSFGLWRRAGRALAEAQARGAVPRGSRIGGRNWVLEVQHLTAGSARLALLVWLRECQVTLRRRPPPAAASATRDRDLQRAIVSFGRDDADLPGERGWQNSRVRQAVEGFLVEARAPLRAAGENGWQLCAEGDDFERWLGSQGAASWLALEDVQEPGPGWNARASWQPQALASPPTQVAFR